MSGVWVLLAALAAATGIGLLTRARDGRFRVSRGRGGMARAGLATAGLATTARPDVAPPGTPPGPGGPAPRAGSPPVPPVPPGTLGAELAALGHAPGPVATLLQFSTAFCAPCRTTRRVLAGVAEIVPGVRHIEVDAESHLELVRRLGIRRTPTVLVLDAAGVEARRATGAPPTRDAVLATLAEIVPRGEEPGPGGDSVDLSGNC